MIVALLHLTKLRNDFTDPTVLFSQVRAPEAAGLARQGPELPAARRVAAPLGGRDAALRRLLVGQRDQVPGRRELPHPRRVVILRPGGPPRRSGEAATSAALVLHLGQGFLRELPGQQPQAARPGHLLRAEERHQQADVPVPRQAVLPPARLDLRPAGAGPRARRHEPELRRCGETQGEVATGPRGAGGDRLPRADDRRRPLLQDRAGRVEHPPGPEAAGAGRGEAGRDERRARARADGPGAGAGRAGRDPERGRRPRPRLPRGSDPAPGRGRGLAPGDEAEAGQGRRRLPRRGHPEGLRGRRPVSGAGRSGPRRRRPRGAAGPAGAGPPGDGPAQAERGPGPGVLGGAAPGASGQRLEAAALAEADPADRAAYEAATAPPVRRLLQAGLRDAHLRRLLGLPAAD